VKVMIKLLKCVQSESECESDYALCFEQWSTT